MTDLQQKHGPVTIMIGIANAVVDALLFMIVLAFTGVVVIALAVAAPLALGVTAIIGRQRPSRRGWTPAEAA